MIGISIIHRGKLSARPKQPKNVYFVPLSKTGNMADRLNLLGLGLGLEGIPWKVFLFFRSYMGMSRNICKKCHSCYSPGHDRRQSTWRDAVVGERSNGSLLTNGILTGCETGSVPFVHKIPPEIFVRKWKAQN